MSNRVQNLRNGGPDMGLLIDDGESDAGSSFAESPADGYFIARSHPREVFVQNPSMEQGNKADEASASRASRSTAGQQSQISSSAASLRTRSYSAESLPVLDAGPAPPDYAAATAYRANPQQTSYQDNVPASERPSGERRTSYGSVDDPRRHSTSADHQTDRNWPFGNANNPFGPGFPFVNGNNPFGQGFPFNNAPGPHASGNGHTPPNDPMRDMSDHVQPRDDLLEETVLLRWNRQPDRKRKSWLSWSHCKPRSYIKILFAVAVVLLIIWVARSSKDASEAQSGDDSKGRKGKIPTVPGGSHGGDNFHNSPQVPSPALPSHAPNPPFPTQSPSRSCPLNFWTDTVAFKFPSPGSFAFLEAVQETNDFAGKVRGNVYVRPAQGEQDSDIVLWISIGTTTPWQVASLDYVQTGDSFQLKMPNLSQSGKTYSKTPCMEINTWIDVRKGVKLDKFAIDAAHLNIVLEEGLVDPNGESSSFLHVKDFAEFSSISGDVSSTYWSSRDTVVRTVSGDITGEYALLDNLGLYSASGVITVDVSPQEADKDDPMPADFQAETVSGTVTVSFPLTDEIPEREYKTQVETASANILGSYIHGRDSVFTTTSGDMIMTLLPYCYQNKTSHLQTSTISATTDVTILSPYKRAGTPWGQLRHSGSSTSGNLRLSYPSEWEGSMLLSTRSGEIGVQGDVRKISEERLPWKHLLVAEKGRGDGELAFEAISGDIAVEVR